MKRSKSSKNQSNKRTRRSSDENQSKFDPPANVQTMSAHTQVCSVIVPENTYSGDTIVFEVDSKELRIELPLARQEVIEKPDVVETVDEPNVASNGSDTTSGEDSGEIPSGPNYVEWVQKVGKYNAETLPDLTPAERRAKKSMDWTAYRCYELACGPIQVLPPTSLNCNNCAKSFPRGNYSGQPALFKCWDCRPKIECTSCHAEKIRKPNHRDEGFKCYNCRKAKPTPSFSSPSSFYIDGDGDRIYDDDDDDDDAEERYRYSERKWKEIDRYGVYD